MSIIDFQDSLRARISQMADEHMQMQEAIMRLPEHQVAAALDELDRHSARLSRLAAALDAFEHVQNIQDAQAASDPDSVLSAQSLSLAPTEDL